MRALRYSFVVLLALAACQQDPYRIRNYGDGSAPDLWPDVGFVEHLPSDARPDTQPGKDLSYDACIKMIEVCNGVDDNCNGQTDEGFDKQTDVRFCDSCKGCSWMYGKNAVPDCAAGKCVIKTCVGGWVDLNKDPSDGCEFQCTYSGAEVCDGVDNDCNGKTDDNVDTSKPDETKFCRQNGPCAGTKMSCHGKLGWICDYDISKGIELVKCTKDQDCGCDGVIKTGCCDTAKGVCPGLIVSNETQCDNVDGDCDNAVDGPWMNPTLPVVLGKDCDLDKTKKGICRAIGKGVCDSTKKSVVCALLPSGGLCGNGTCDPGESCQLCPFDCGACLPGVESCNGLDDDCDGIVDNLDLAKNPGAEAWVTVGTFKIFMYEATRPDAGASQPGIISDGRPCSLPGRLPWASVTKEDAEAACVRVGGHLCTTAQWKQACRGTANTDFPYGATFQPKTCNGHAYDLINPHVLPTDQPGGTCVSTFGAAKIYNMSGNLKEWTATGFSAGKPTGYGINGGAYDTPSIDTYGAGLSCTYDLPAPSSSLQLPTLGFRCCK